MTEAEIKRMLRKRVAVKVGPAARALGLGRFKLKSMIEDGIVPVNAVGNVPCSWLLKAMKTTGGKAKAA
jgi:hypothetical protein